MASLCLSVSAQTAVIDNEAIAGKKVSKIEFPNNGEQIKITYSDNSVAENLDLSEVKIQFENIVDAINYLNAEAKDEDTPVFYYDLQGRSLLQAPQRGLFIMKKGNKVVKVLNK
jgi:hypothetical protein